MKKQTPSLTQESRPSVGDGQVRRGSEELEKTI